MASTCQTRLSQVSKKRKVKGGIQRIALKYTRQSIPTSTAIENLGVPDAPTNLNACIRKESAPLPRINTQLHPPNCPHPRGGRTALPSALLTDGPMTPDPASTRRLIKSIALPFPRSRLNAFSAID